MSNKALETLSWVLIYSGLLLACLGFFLRASSEALGWALMAVGAMDTLVGVVLIVVRSRRNSTPDNS